jgi:hypothetical protein
MESPRPLQDTKHVRWMGRPSEEQLLGPLHRPPHEVSVSFEPPPPPDWGLDETPVAAGNATAVRRWRIGPRDLVALAAVAAVVWLAVRDGDGLPFRSSEPAAPAAASNVVKATLAPDRADFKRTSPSSDGNASADANGPGGKSDGGQKDKKGSSGPGGKDDGKDDDPPTGGGGGDKQTKPLLEATIPGVGTVTVDQPELPAVPDLDTPALPDTGDLLPETSTVPLP